MAELTIPGVGDTGAAGWAKLMGDAAPSGLLVPAGGGGLALSVDSNPMSVLVSPGTAIVRGFRYELTQATRLPIAVNATARTRLDRIVARLTVASTDPAATGEVRLYVVPGTAATTPVLPTLTRTDLTWEESVGYVLVPANAASTTVIPAGNVAAFGAHRPLPALAGRGRLRTGTWDDPTANLATTSSGAERIVARIANVWNAGGEKLRFSLTARISSTNSGGQNVVRVRAGSGYNVDAALTDPAVLLGACPGDPGGQTGERTHTFEIERTMPDGDAWRSYAISLERVSGTGAVTFVVLTTSQPMQLRIDSVNSVDL